MTVAESQDARGRRIAAPAALGLAATSVGVLPFYLIGALSFELRDQFGLSAPLFGFLAATFYLSSAVSSVPAGRWASRHSARHGLGVGIGIGIGALVVIATSTVEAQLFVGTIAGGLANSLIQLACNEYLAVALPPGRWGFALGIKQAAVPLAGMAAGLSVPILLATVSWRFIVVVLAAIAVPLLIGVIVRLRVPRGQDRSAMRALMIENPRGVVLLTIAGGIGATGANAMSAFLVDYLVGSGMAAHTAGLIFGCAWGAGLVFRVACGLLVDRRPVLDLKIVTALIVLGLVGSLMIASQSLGWIVAVGSLLAFAGGGGWNGVFIFAVVRRSKGQVARVTGLSQVGLNLGGVTGPIAFGLVAAGTSYTVGWIFVAACFCIGAMLTTVVALRTPSR